MCANILSYPFLHDCVPTDSQEDIQDQVQVSLDPTFTATIRPVEMDSGDICCGQPCIIGTYRGKTVHWVYCEQCHQCMVP